MMYNNFLLTLKLPLDTVATVGSLTEKMIKRGTQGPVGAGVGFLMPSGKS